MVPAGLMFPLLLQNMEMVPVPTKSYGNFFEGDCYILLSVGQPEIPQRIRDGFCPRGGWGTGKGVPGQSGLGTQGLV